MQKNKKIYRFQREVTTITKSIEILEIEAKNIIEARNLLDCSEPVEIYEESTRRDAEKAECINIDKNYSGN